MRRLGGGMGARRHGGAKKLYRLNHTRKVVRGPDRRNMRHRRALDMKYKNSRRTQGGRSGGSRPGRRMDHYHMRRRYLHPGLAGGGMLGAGMMDMEDMMDDDPFQDEGMLMDDDMGLFGSDTEGSESGSDSEDNGGSEAGEEITDGPPPLESEEHCHVFFYHSSASEDTDQMEYYVSILENSPNDLKVFTSERDFKQELTVTQNLMLSVGLSQHTVLHCSQEFVENDLKNYEATVAAMGLTDENLKQKIVVLLCPDVECPESLQKLQKFSMTDADCFENLTKLLGSGPTSGVRGGIHGAEPSAPPPDSFESDHTPPKETLPLIDNKELPIYPNGLVIKQVTATKFKEYEVRDEEQGLCAQYCPRSDMLCPMPELKHAVPASLTRRGLQVTEDEFEDILQSLNESAQVTFFQKAVDCSMHCLYLSAILITAAVTIPLWFLIVGILQQYKTDDEPISESIFWSFMICIIFIPTGVALVMLAVIIHLVNYKYLKYRIKMEEFNKRFRETNLVLHCRKAFWSCHGRLKLYFIYYNFEQCQQTLYCHVHDNIKLVNGHSIEENGNHLADNATLKLDKIMKRVNTLTKKFEWDYFEALTTQTLPAVEEKEHRKKGMCFCQYVLHREEEVTPASVVEQVKGQVKSMKKNALKKSHRRKNRNTDMYMGPIFNRNGTTHFGNGTKPSTGQMV